jgi:hypothetical protein
LITQPFPIFAALSHWHRSLLEWLGARFDDAPADARAELLWTNLPSSWGVFVFLALLAALFYGVFALYRREMACCPAWVKGLLATLRSGVVLLLACIFLGPAVVYLQNRTVKPTIVVARDASQSMNTADAYADLNAARAIALALGKSESEIAAIRPTRVQIVNDLLDSPRLQLLDRLASNGRLQVVDFAEQATKVDVQQSIGLVPSDDVKSDQSPEHFRLPPLVAEGRSTDLTSAVHQSLTSERPAAIVIFTDGQHTGKNDPREAAREAQARGVPLLMVGLGDPSRRKNLAVAKVYASPQVWQQEPFEIDAVVHFQDAETSSAKVELREQRIGSDEQAVGEGTVVSTLEITAPDGGTGQATAQFSHTAADPGRYVYRVRALPIAGESEETDNQSSSSVVKVLSRQSVRVLLVAGAPTWDYRLVQKLLSRDKTIQVSCWLQTLDEERAQEGTRPISRLPITKNELFYYDVILLFDPNTQEIDRAWIELLKQFVGEHSGGLLFMAGPKHSSRLLTSGRTAEFGKLLPVTFGDVGALEVAALLSGNQRAWPLKLVAANADNPIMRFYPQQDETLKRWETLPGILWSFPCQDARPAAQVLVEHSDPTVRGALGARPLMVAGRYGSGRTLYIGFNGTWRWRKAGRQAEFFDKFWIQSIRYLLEGRSLEGRRRGSIETDRDRYEVGQRITLTARLQDTAYEPLTTPKVDATIRVAGQSPETVPLLPVSNQPGSFQATLMAKTTGIHQVQIALAGGGSGGGQIESSFDVELPTVETNQVWLNKPLLIDLANLSGGRYFDVDQLDGLADAVPDRKETIETRSPPRPLWDVRGMLVALVGLLCVEWLVRKRFRLL